MGRVASRTAAKLAGRGAAAAGMSAPPPADEGLARARDLARAGSYAEARDALVATIERRPDSVDAYVQLSAVLLRTGFVAESTWCREQAEALSPRSADGRVILAGALAAEGLHEAAAQSYREALHQRPDDAAAWNNLGLSLAAAGQLDEAATAYRQAVQLAPDLPQPHANLAEALRSRDDLHGAVASFQRAVHLKPDWAEAWNNLGVAARALGDTALAERAWREAVRLRPAHIEAHYNLGNALMRPGSEAQARSSFQAAIALRPDHPEALYGLALASPDLGEALDLYRRALAARPEFPEALVGDACARLKACEWEGISDLKGKVEQLVLEQPAAAVAPFSFLQLSGDPRLQQRCARNWSHNRIEATVSRVGALDPLSPVGERAGRLRVGYLSGDFRNHAVGNLVADLFHLHDRSRFEVIGYSTGPDDGSRTRARIAASFDTFVDARELTSRALAQRIRGDAIDVLVDLGGYTDHGRSEVLALRAAPVQVSYLGYPGTMGAGFVDAIISDAFVTPDSSACWYDERLVLLPTCYQISSELDAGPAVPPPTRASLGLPDGAFVLCCFNNSYKIQPAVFSAWMRILQQLPESVLWLAEFNALARENLRREAAALGIAAERLVFAPVVSVEQHSARLPLADLFLDTYPYSAGATATQTLRAGVPLLTIAGDCYVSRMAGSMLSALGLEELVTYSLSDYERTATALARDQARLNTVRESLREAQGRTRLFDPVRGTRALEGAYDALWAEHGHRGEHPERAATRQPLRVADAA